MWSRRKKLFAVLSVFTYAFCALLLLCIFLGVLFVKENEAIDRLNTLNIGRLLSVTVEASPVDPANEGGFVHIAGQATTQETLADDLFPVKAQALRLTRIVEMYQWQESVRKRSGKPNTYSYEKDWHRNWIPSELFTDQNGHANPNSMPFGSADLVAKTITLGDFELGDAFKRKIETILFPVTAEHLATMDPAFAQRFTLAGGILHSGDPATPRVGDLRITFHSAPPGSITVVGQQHGERVVPGEMGDDKIALLEHGLVGRRAVFGEAEDDAQMTIWILRALCFAVAWPAFYFLLGPIKTVRPGNAFVRSGLFAQSGLLALASVLLLCGLIWFHKAPLIASLVLLLFVASCGGSWALVRRVNRRMELVE